MSPYLRRRLVLATSSIVLVVLLSGITAFIALHSTRTQLHMSREIDHQLALIDHLRGQTRELGLSMRRYMITLDLYEKQRVMAIADEMKKDRQALDARHSIALGPALEADIDAYVVALLAMTEDHAEDPIARLTHFEDELIRYHAPLSTMFDEIVERETSRRDALRSALSLARGAEWTVGIGGLIAVLLAVGGCLALLGAARNPLLMARAAEPAPDAPALLR